MTLHNPALVPLAEIGAGIVGRAVTATLYVSPNGSGAGGKTWATAYTTIQDALDACSTNVSEATQILVAPLTSGANFYDIDRTGDPTWSANVIIKGTHRNWPKIKNTHDDATSIMKLTGHASLMDLNFNLGTGNVNGVILTGGGSRVQSCHFVGESLGGAAVALWLDGSPTKNIKVLSCGFLGRVSHMTGILIDEVAQSRFLSLRIHECITAIQVIGTNSDTNDFRDLDIGDCALGIDIDAGNDQHFEQILFHHNTLNVDDEVGDSGWNGLKGAFPITVEPDDMVGVTLTADNVANVWGADTELRAAVASTRPFRVVAVVVEPTVAQWYNLRLSSDSGATFFDHVMVSTARAAGSTAPSGTEFIFNAGTRVSGSIKAETGGSDTMKVWLKVQEI